MRLRGAWPAIGVCWVADLRFGEGGVEAAVGVEFEAESRPSVEALPIALYRRGGEGKEGREEEREEGWEERATGHEW